MAETIPGPAGNILSLSQSNLSSSSTPFQSKLQLDTSAKTTSWKSAYSTPNLKSPTSVKDEESLASPVSIATSQDSLNDSLGSISSLNMPATPQKVLTDQILTVLLDTCMNAGLLYSSYNIVIGKNDVNVTAILQDIKDEFAVNQTQISLHSSSPFISKWMWGFHKSLLALNNCVSKLRVNKRYIGLFSTNDGRKKRVEKYFKHVYHSWQELMMNLALAMSSGGVSGKAKEEEKNPIMLCLQGDKALFGFGAPKSYETAYRCYTEAAKAGLPDAANMIGCMLENGLGVEKDLIGAITWYQSAAEKKYADALNNLGRIFETGASGVQIDYKKSIDCYLEAARQGHADAQTNLGYILQHGVGCDIDMEKAISWYRIAAEKSNYARAQNLLGSVYYLGQNGIARDDQLAARYFRQSAEQGNAHALNNLGICFEEGRGVMRDIQNAKDYYEKASNLNHASATNNLGYMLLLEKKYTNAAKLFNIASAQGSIDALYNLGSLYESGVLSPSQVPDPVMAFTYYMDAATKGYSKAQAKISEMYQTGRGCDIDEAESARWSAKSRDHAGVNPVKV